MPKTLKIGILETGRPPESLADKIASYAEMFTQMIKAHAPSDWTYHFYPVIDGEFPDDPSECDAYLITGSKYGAYDDEPWINELKSFIQKAYAHGKILIGICFGHQILAQALGGKVEKSPKGWGIGVHHYDWCAQTPEWLSETDIAGHNDFAIVAFHQDQIVKVPPQAQVLAQSPFCPYAALVYGNQVLSFQGHPEFSAAFERLLIDEHRADRLTKEQADKAAESLSQPIDKDAIGAGITAFIMANCAK